MSISMRDLFSRQGIDNEIISLRNSLSNHFEGLQIGLREASRRFLVLADGNGYGRGCHHPSQIVAGDLAYVVPSWVSVHDYETRTVEGILTQSKISGEDFPLKPWHTYYDWCVKIRLDKQYTYLNSISNIEDHGNVIECEWDTAFLPTWAWPQEGDRIWMVGRWIYDCGHPCNPKEMHKGNPQYHGHKTEIHPPKAVVSFRTEAVSFAGNSGPTPANNAVIYIGQNGGYWYQPINDQDYAFDLYLPPKPYVDAVPKWEIWLKTGSLPVQPHITPYPASNPRLLRVIIPLKGAIPQPEEYGIIVSAGWSDPHGTESAAIQKVSVNVNKIFMDADYDTSSGDEWYVYIGVNGRWKVWENIGGDSASLNYAVDLDLHPSDQIHITACGFQADLIHDYMGDNSGYTWAQISDPNLTQAQRETIEDAVFWQLSGSLDDLNDLIGNFSQYHNPSARGTFENASDIRDYRLQYTIESR